MAFYREGEPQAIFALVEQPFLRLQDSHRFTVVSKAKKAHLEELIGRLQRTTFYFPVVVPQAQPLVSVILDEIARNVFCTHDIIRFLNGLAP
ncbi:MAG: hypothetical protein LLG04_13825 [Parachlamydia sp.]|nr:hypothetical protein [Parachlamydia sp.]